MPEQLEEEGMELPDAQFCRDLRGEMAPLHDQVASIALGNAEGVATTAVDCTPWDQKEYIGAVMQVKEKSGARRDWCGTGISEIGDQAAKAEALAVKECVFDSMRNSLTTLHKAYSAKHGEAAAAAALPDASAIGVRQCVGGVTLSDGASAALAGQREFHELVVADVKTAMGEEEYNKLTPEEQKRCTKVWCVTFLEWADPRPLSRSRHARRAVAPRIHYEYVTRRSFFVSLIAWSVVGLWLGARGGSGTVTATSTSAARFSTAASRLRRTGSSRCSRPRLTRRQSGCASARI